MTHRLPGGVTENEGRPVSTGGTGLPPSGLNSAEDRPLSEPSPDFRQQLMDDAAALDHAVTAWQDKALTASNHFFEGMGEVISAQLRFMAQKPGEPTKQIAQAVIKYLTTDYNRNNEQLYDDAVAAVDAFQKDPARLLGQQAGGIAVNVATEGAGRLMTGGVTAGAAQAVKRTKEIAAAQQAARRLREIERMAEVPGSAPVCIPLEDCFWRAMRNATGDPVYEAKFNGPRPTSWAEVHDELAKNFGNKINGVPFPAAHALGIPDPMPLPDVVKELERVGPGSEGIVIVKTANGDVHAFNAANLKGRVVLVDDQKQFWGGGAERKSVEQTLGPIIWSLFYRTR
jgi:hypothetical protein